MKVIFTNDDFGMSYGFTEAIKDCFLNGVTTSASICVNGTAYDYAVKLLKSKLKKLSVGLHLNLNYGITQTKDLMNKESKYKYGFLQYFFLLLFQNRQLLKAIEYDLDYQFKKALRDDLLITFVNGHDHIYMIPSIFEISCKLCKKYGIKYIRLPREPYYSTGIINKDVRTIFSSNLIKFLLLNKFCKNNYKMLEKYGLKTTDTFYGILHTQKMDSSTIKGALSNALVNNYNNVEILGHPSYTNDSRDINYESNLYEKFAKAKERIVETKTFKDQKIKNFLKQNYIIPSSYINLV